MPFLVFFSVSCFLAEPAFGGPGNTYLYSYQTYPSPFVKATLGATRATWRYGQPSISRLPSRASTLFRESVRRGERGASAREGARVEVSEEDDQHGGVAIEEQRSSGLGMF